MSVIGNFLNKVGNKLSSPGGVIHSLMGAPFKGAALMADSIFGADEPQKPQSPKPQGPSVFGPPPGPKGPHPHPHGPKMPPPPPGQGGVHIHFGG